MNKNSFNAFKQKHPVLVNFLLVMVVFVIGIYSIFLMLDIFTNHGSEVKVPDVRYKPLNEAIAMLDDAGLDYEVDSIYNEDSTPGSVIDQSPNPGSMVKSTRVIYLTMNMITPPKVTLPTDLTDMPGSDGVTLLKSLGFKNVTTDTIPSPDLGLIVDIKVNGHHTVVGTKVAVNAKVVLTVGDGSMDTEEYDPLGSERDSLINEGIRRGKIKVEKDSLGNTKIE